MRSARGLTLIEMIVVLGILAIVASVAVSSIDSSQNQARFESTQRQLGEVEIAVFGSTSNLPSAAQNNLSFLTDLGRLPKRFDSQRNGNIGDDPNRKLDLRELWHPYLGGVSSNVFPAFLLKPGTNDAIGNDSNVLIGAGWRGPYLRLPVGSEELSDGWGNAFDVAFLNMTQLSGIRSLGSDGVDAPPADQYNENITAVLPTITGGNPTVTISGTVMEFSGGSLVPLSTSVNVYALVPQLSNNDLDIDIVRINATVSAGGVFNFSGLSAVPPGTRVLGVRKTTNTGLGADLTQTFVVPTSGLSNIQLVIRP